MGARVKARRKALKMSQTDLAKKAEVGKAMVSAVEVGRFMPSVKVLAALGRALESGVDVLLYGQVRPRGQAPLPGMGIEERISRLPEAMREFVLLALARAENAAAHVPAQFLNAPTSETWPEFAAYLEALSRLEVPKPPEQ